MKACTETRPDPSIRQSIHALSTPANGAVCALVYLVMELCGEVSPGSSNSVEGHLPITPGNVNKIVLASAKASGSDCSACNIMTGYRRKYGAIVDSLLIEPGLRQCGRRNSKENISCTSKLRSLLEEFSLQISTGALSSTAIRSGVEVICAMSESNLTSVRFITTLMMVCMLPLVTNHVSTFSVSDALTMAVVARTRDTSDIIRRLAAVDGVCKLTSIFDDEAYIHAIKGLLSDPSKANRGHGLAALNMEINKPNPKRRRVFAQIGADVVRRCFDVETGIAVAAIRLLCHPTVGESMLGTDESAFMRISNLVWVVGDIAESPKPAKRARTSDDPLMLSRAALAFIDRHILASPGILSNDGGGAQKLAMVVEFIEQYTDGYVAALTSRFIASLMSTLQRGSVIQNFLLQSRLFADFISGCVDTMEPCVGDEFVTARRRLNTVLEILLAAVRLSPCHVRLSLLSESVRMQLVRAMTPETDDSHSIDDFDDGQVDEGSDDAAIKRRSAVQIVKYIVESRLAAHAGRDEHPASAPTVDAHQAGTTSTTRQGAISYVREHLMGDSMAWI